MIKLKILCILVRIERSSLYYDLFHIKFYRTTNKNEQIEQ